MLVRHNPLPRVLVAGGLGLTTFVVARSALEDVAPPPTEEVVVLTRPVRAGDVVGRSDVQRVRLPTVALPRAPLAADPVGSTARVDLVAGEVVLTERLGGRGLAALLPPGTRALAVPRAAGTPPLEPGQLVDLVSGGATVVEAATVLSSDDAGITVAVPADSAPVVAEAVAAGTVTLLLAG